MTQYVYGKWEMENISPLYICWGGDFFN